MEIVQIYAEYLSWHPETEVLYTEVYADGTYWTEEIRQDDPRLEGIEIVQHNYRPITDNPPKILNFVNINPIDNFHNVNYINGLSIRLYRKDTFVRGVKIKSEFFENAERDPNNPNEFIYDNLIVSEDYYYTFNTEGKAIERTLCIHWTNSFTSEHAPWFDDSGIYPLTKIRKKYYNDQEAQMEGVTRRNNVINILKADLKSLMIQNGVAESTAQARITRYFSDNAKAVEAYLTLDSVFELNSANTADTNVWLGHQSGHNGMTYRQFISDAIQRPVSNLIPDK